MKIVAKASGVRSVGSTDSFEGRSYPRKEMSEILVQYNKSIGNDAAAMRQAERLCEENSRCVFTGQQLGFLTGPIYTILKGISCLVQARELNAIPIFWLATEDHDIGEIDHTFLIDPLGNLKKYALSFRKNGYFVEDLTLTERHIEVISQFFSDLHIDTAEFSESFYSGASFSLSMASLLAYLFRGTGLLFIEPHLLRPYARPIIERELIDADIIHQKMGHHFNFENGTNIFFKTESGKRSKIIKDGSSYQIDEQKHTLEQLLKIVSEQPERFSTNVAARPLVQSALFPTVAYVAGPNELKYYANLETLHRFHDIHMPMLIPRLQATFIPADISAYLEKGNILPWDSLPNWNAEKLALHGLPSDALHRIRNTLLPKMKSQERVLSWWQFQAHSQERLVTSLIHQANPHSAEHLFCFL